jgi:cytochrome c-type biogenesis protein CcmH
MTRTFLLAFLLAVAFITPVVRADQAQPLGEDPEVEKRLTKLSQELRCLVCQNETLADSRADLAEDLRREIRIQIKAGKSDKEIIDFLTSRYGEFVLYRPVVGPKTYLLWFGPFLLLLTGLALLFRYVKTRRDMIAEVPLSTEEQQRVAELLSSKSGKETA